MATRGVSVTTIVAIPRRATGGSALVPQESEEDPDSQAHERCGKLYRPIIMIG
ncbi:hypothetical protein CERSUDRAFT_87807 [Gelatoporia subvermispora B]|uniref:Uncharacterized protein n=1 Tax=Ceriporiopsis subvermispora (strain B) TaxID=914234 RepID=M2PBB5_CERS8|nr:hypothetical protein CERSUDRAFT_87807 [Gelatoporia subvermispora B]